MISNRRRKREEEAAAVVGSKPFSVFSDATMNNPWKEVYDALMSGQ
jgi:hypothetical protein